MNFIINNINNNLLLPSIPKTDDLPITNAIKNNIIIKNNDTVITKENSNYKDYNENKYILPLIVDSCIRLIKYCIK